MFGNGTRFDWYGGDAQEEEVVEGALVHEVETGFVTVDQGKGWGLGESGEGVGHAVEAVGGGLGGDLLLQHSGFEGPGAAQTPVGRGHLLDHPQLEAVGGLEAIEIVAHEAFETLGGLVVEEEALGEEAVAGGVAGGTLFSFRGDRAMGESAVGA